MRIRSAVAFAGIAFLSSFHPAASGKWERTIVLRGGWVAALAVKDGNLFASTKEGGVFLSMDQGVTWRAVNVGLPANAKACCLAAAGQDLFLGTAEHGIFLSKNNGGYWRAVNEGIPEQSLILCLVAVGPDVIAGTSAGVFRTRDSGASWMPMNEGWTRGTLVRCLVAAGPAFFAGTNAGPFVRSASGTWAPLGAGWPEDARVDCLAVAGTDVFAGTELRGVLRSTGDNGRWEQVNKGIPQTEIHCLIASDGNLLAGTGGGKSVHIGDLKEGQVAWMPYGPGVFLSEDRGARWKPVNSGLRRAPEEPELERMVDLWVECLVVCGPYLIAGTQAGEIWRMLTSNLK